MMSPIDRQAQRLWVTAGFCQWINCVLRSMFYPSAVKMLKYVMWSLGQEWEMSTRLLGFRMRDAAQNWHAVLVSMPWVFLPHAHASHATNNAFFFCCWIKKKNLLKVFIDFSKVRPFCHPQSQLLWMCNIFHMVQNMSYLIGSIKYNKSFNHFDYYS